MTNRLTERMFVPVPAQKDTLEDCQTQVEVAGWLEANDDSSIRDIKQALTRMAEIARDEALQKLADGVQARHLHTSINERSANGSVRLLWGAYSVAYENVMGDIRALKAKEGA